MQTNPAIRLWTRALAALRVGARAAARTPLTRLATASHMRVDYWLALAHAAESPFTAIDCLERALSIDPANETALAGMTWNRWLLTRSSQTPPEQIAPATADVASAETTADVAQHPAEEVADEPVEPIEPAGERASSVLQKIEELEAALETDLTPARSVFTDEPGLDPLTRDLNAAEQLAAEALAEEAASAVPCPAVDVQTPAAAASTPVESQVVDIAPETLPADLAVTMAESVLVEEIAASLPSEDVSTIAPLVGESSAVTVITPPSSPVHGEIDTPVAQAVATPDAADLSGTTSADETSDGAGPSVPSPLPPITEQELATAEWQRWVTGNTPVASPNSSANPETARIVNEVSERLAHALQRVLKQKGLAPATEAPAGDNEPEAISEAPAPADVAATSPLELRVAPTFPSTNQPVALPSISQEATILVVDDSPTIRRVVVDSLTAHGYRVCEAADGVEGIREIATQRPDLILLDITMPRLDGYRLCRLVKSHATTRHIPVVMLSGKDGTFDRLRGRLAGSSDYITKPFDTPALLQKIEHFLNKARKAAPTNH